MIIYMDWMIVESGKLPLIIVVRWLTLNDMDRYGIACKDLMHYDNDMDQNIQSGHMEASMWAPLL